MKELVSLAALAVLLFAAVLVANAEASQPDCSYNEAIAGCERTIHRMAAMPQDKVTICHATSSASNPFVTIEISRNGWDGEGRNDHTLHAGDYEGPCDVDPTPDPTPNPTPEPTPTPGPTPTPDPTPTPGPTPEPTPDPTPDPTPTVTPTAPPAQIDFTG